MTSPRPDAFKCEGLFLQLEIGNRIHFSAIIDDTSREAFLKVWEVAGPKIHERLIQAGAANGYSQTGSIRVTPVMS